MRKWHNQYLCFTAIFWQLRGKTPSEVEMGQEDITDLCVRQ